MNEQQQRTLTAGLKALAEQTRDAGASPHVEQAVLAAMRSGRHPGQDDPRHQPARFLALAAGLLIAVCGSLWALRPIPQRTPQFIEPSGFVAVPQAGALPEIESASIVRVSLPVAALPVYGVAILPDGSRESVQAELLVAQDGQARAIRLVNDLNSRSTSDD